MSVRRDLSFETRQRCRLADGSAGAGAGAARRTHAECYQPRQSGGRAVRQAGGREGQRPSAALIWAAENTQREGAGTGALHAGGESGGMWGYPVAVAGGGLGRWALAAAASPPHASPHRHNWKTFRFSLFSRICRYLLDFLREGEMRATATHTGPPPTADF